MSCKLSEGAINTITTDKKSEHQPALKILIKSEPVKHIREELNGCFKSSSRRRKAHEPQRKSAVINKKPKINQNRIYSTKPTAITFPISSLTLNLKNWTICARVTNKSVITTWFNSGRGGKLFSLVFLDESGEIRATGFNENCKTFYSILEENKVYYVTNGVLKQADRTYSHVNSNLEMVFRGNTIISPCKNPPNLPKTKFDFIPISDLSSIPKGTFVDVIGICKGFSDIEKVTKRVDCRTIQKRDVFLIDESNTQITVTLWGESAESFDPRSNSVVALKGASVSNFHGCSLNMNPNSSLIINPEIDEAYQIKDWYERNGTSSSQSLSAPSSRIDVAEWKYLRQITTKKSWSIGENFITKATVLCVKHENCLYKACPAANCYKKVVDQGFDNYRCEKCSKVFSDFKWRLILHVGISDFSSSIWVTCFQDVAEVLLETTADELGMLQIVDNVKFTSVLCSANSKEFIFKLRMKEESFKGETKVKIIVTSVKTIDYEEYLEKLTSDLPLTLYVDEKSSFSKKV